MSSRFGPESSIAQVLSWIAALVMANVVGLLISLPVVTFGVGLGVMTLVSLRLIASESTAIAPAVAQVVRKAALPAILLALIDGLLFSLLLWEWSVTTHLASHSMALIVRALIVFVVLIAAFTHVWVWPMFAHRLAYRGRVSVKDLPRLASAALLASAAKLHRTLLALLVVAGPLVLASISLPWAIRLLFWFVVFGIAFAQYVCVLATYPVLSTDQVDEASSES